VITDSPTNFAYALCQGILRDSRIVPYILKKLVFCDQVAGPLNQDPQNGERAGMQVDMLSERATKLTCSQIYKM